MSNHIEIDVLTPETDHPKDENSPFLATALIKGFVSPKTVPTLDRYPAIDVTYKGTSQSNVAEFQSAELQTGPPQQIILIFLFKDGLPLKAGEDSSEYELGITAYIDNQTVSSDPRKFTVVKKKATPSGRKGPVHIAQPAATGFSHEMVTVTSHDDGEDITAQAAAFVAFGTIYQYQVTSVTMNAIEANHIDQDLFRASWTATFSPLAPGIYTLRALDSGNNSDAKTGLHVDAP
jgi:hypothetical protein